MDDSSDTSGSPSGTSRQAQRKWRDKEHTCPKHTCHYQPLCYGSECASTSRAAHAARQDL
eukprot:3470191-Amphidinium_carterae.1